MSELIGSGRAKLAQSADMFRQRLDDMTDLGHGEPVGSLEGGQTVRAKVCHPQAGNG